MKTQSFKEFYFKLRLPCMFFLLLVLAWQGSGYVKAGEGSTPSVHEILNEANQIAQTMGLRTKADILIEVALAYANATETESAKSILKLAVDYILKLESGEFNQSSSLDERGSWPISKLINIAAAFQKIGHSADRESTLSLAIRIAEEKVTDIEVRVFTLQEIAVVQVKFGEVEEAKRTLQKALKEAELVEGLKGSKGNGKLSSQFSEEQLKPLKVERLRSLASTAVSNAFLEVGDKVSAILTLDQLLVSLGGLPKDSFALRAIAIAQARVGRLEGAEEAINKLLKMDGHGFNSASEELKMDVLMMVAEVLEKTGKKKTAVNYINRGMQRAESLKERDSSPRKWVYSSGLTRISMAQVRLGYIKEALQTAAIIPDEERMNQTLNLIASQQLQAGDLRGGRQTVSGKVYPYFLVELASAEAKNGNVKEALEAIESILPDTKFDEPILRHMRAPALRPIASAWVETGDRKEVLSWARNQVWEIEKVYALLGVIDGLLNSKNR